TRGPKRRIDSTVVASAIHYPTDSTLLFDGVRVLSRLVQHAATALSGSKRRLGARRTRLAKQLARRIEATAAMAASAATRAERPRLYRRLLAVAQASVRQAHQVQQWLAGWSYTTAQRLGAGMRRTAPGGAQVMGQA